MNESDTVSFHIIAPLTNPWDDTVHHVISTPTIISDSSFEKMSIAPDANYDMNNYFAVNHIGDSQGSGCCASTPSQGILRTQKLFYFKTDNNNYGKLEILSIDTSIEIISAFNFPYVKIQSIKLRWALQTDGSKTIGKPSNIIVMDKSTFKKRISLKVFSTNRSNQINLFTNFNDQIFTVGISDLNGRTIKLFDHSQHGDPYYSWNLLDEGNQTIRNGVYLFFLRSMSSKTVSKKFLLLN